MSLIIISADKFAEGREIAHRVAEASSYRYLGRELLSQVARENGVSEEDLTLALEGRRGILSRRSRRKRMMAYIQAACLKQLLEGDIVCYGLAAHLYVGGISHALKARIISEPENRDGEAPSGKGGDTVRRRQRRQSRWSLEMFGLDETDPSLYDLVIGLGTLEKEKAVEIICDTVDSREFRPMTYSLKCMEDKALAAEVRRKLVERFIDVRVEAKDGKVVVRLQSLKRERRKKEELVRGLVEGVPGIARLEVHLIKDFFSEAAQSSR